MNFNYKILILCTLYSVFVNLTLFKFFFITQVIDLLSRSSLNNFFFNCLFFLWTNLWYLFFYFFILTLIIVFFKNKFLNLLEFITLTLFLYLFTTLYIDINNINSKVIDSYLFTEKENILLINSINRVHPLLLHSCISFFYIYKILFRIKCLQNLNILILAFSHTLKNFVLVIIVTLYLGSWWALQEGSWGGWWNWDISEVFGLIIFFKIILVYHLRLYIIHEPFLKNYVYTSLSSLLLFYCLMQVNFSLVSHNFGFRNLKSFNPELFFIVLFVFTFTYSFRESKSLLKIYNIFLPKKLKMNFINICFVFISLTLYVSWFALIHNFIWHSLEVKIYMLKVEYRVVSIALILFILSIFYELDFFSFFITVFIIPTYNIFLFYFFKRLPVSLNNLSLHILLFYFILLVYFTSDNVIDVWFTLLNEVYTSKVYNYSLNTLKIESDLNFLRLTTALESKSFNLEVGKSRLKQMYYPTGLIKFYVTEISDTSSLLINSIFFLILIFFLSLLNSCLHF